MRKAAVNHSIGNIKILCAVCSKTLLVTAASNFNFVMQTPGTFMMVCPECEPRLEKILDMLAGLGPDPFLDMFNEMRGK